MNCHFQIVIFSFKGKGSEKIDQKAIELAANELELTELEESLSTKNPDEVENASQTSESLRYLEFSILLH